jgi:hypothetical protein
MSKKKRKRSVVLDVVVVLLLVIAGILAAMVYAGVNNGRRRPRINRDRALVYAIDGGLRAFRADFGHLPHDALDGGDETNDPRWIRRWLLGWGDDGERDEKVRGNPAWTGPYVEIQIRKDLGEDKDYVLVDGWGNPICFEVKDPIFNRERWDVWSLGPDGKGTRDMGEIIGETPELRRKNYEEHEEGGERVNADNVGNWR